MAIQINNELRDRAYQCACKHGFHDKEYSDAHFMMLIITEISEAVDADRKGRKAKSDRAAINEKERMERLKEHFKKISNKSHEYLAHG